MLTGILFWFKPWLFSFGSPARCACFAGMAFSMAWDDLHFALARGLQDYGATEPGTMAPLIPDDADDPDVLGDEVRHVRGVKALHGRGFG